MPGTETNNQILRQAGGGLLWALLLILAPLDLLMLGALVWIPLFVWREIVRTKRYGFFHGALVRYPLIVGAVVLAAMAPTKTEDRKVGPFQRINVTLGQLAASNVIYPLRYAQNEAIEINLSSVVPTRREVMKAIAEQPGFEAHVFHCGVGATVLFGSGVGRIRVTEPSLDNAR